MSETPVEPGDDPMGHSTQPTDEAALLRRHVESWRREGLLTEEQAAVLVARIAGAQRGKGSGEASRGSLQAHAVGRGVSLLVNFGAIVLALGLIVFFASNWAEMGRGSRVVCLLGLTGGFQIAGYELLRPMRWTFPKLGHALLVLGCLLFAASIFLIADLYSLFGDASTSTAVVCAACFAVAYLCRSRLVLVIALAAFIAWFGMRVGYAWGCYWAYLWKPIHFAGLGLLLVVVGAWQGWRRFPEFLNVYLLVGQLTAYTSLLVLSQRDAQDWREPFVYLEEPSVLALLALPYLLAALGAIWLYRSSFSTGLRLYSPPVILGAAVFAVLVVTSASAIAGVESRYWWMALLTLLTIAGAYLGLAWRSAYLLNVSLTFLVIDIYTRYFEWFWDEMPKSLFFMLGGAALLVGGIYLERFRRHLLARHLDAMGPGGAA